MVGVYILDGKVVKPATCAEWIDWFDLSDKHVAQDHVAEVLINTVFLGLDHGDGEGPPLLFETIIWGREESEWCSTWDQAIEQHKAACDWVRRNLLH